MSAPGQEPIRTLTFNDAPVADFLEELGSYLEGHLAQLDVERPPADYLVRWFADKERHS